MTHTRISRCLVALHVGATLALCAIAARMLIMGFAVLGELHDVFSNAPLVRSVPSGWTPEISLGGTHELASFAAFPGGPALLVLGIYLACLEHATWTGEASRRVASGGLPVLGFIWSFSAVGVWLWSLQSVRVLGYIPTHAGTIAGLLFVGALVCFAAIIHIRARDVGDTSSLNEKIAA